MFDVGNHTDDMMQILTCSAESIDYLKHREIDDKIRFRTRHSRLSTEYKNVLTLNGQMAQCFSNLADGSIITLFDKTPYPTDENDVVCPHFIELKWANGCAFNCAWCYLNGTLRFRPGGKKPYLKDVAKIKHHIQSYLDSHKEPSLLNSGELSDSLVFEGNGNALSRIIIPLFKSQNNHKLLILTKSCNVNGILSSNSQQNLVVSFSVNSFKVAKRWENGAPSPKSRILAAKKLYDAGYPIRIRIDPIVPIDNWESEYKELIDYVFRKITPDRITLGSLRGLQSTINHSEDRSWVEYLDEGSNWGKKISFTKRLGMYRMITDYLGSNYEYDCVGLCKETIGMWNELGKNYKRIKCNCML